jgi:hypothetical protein
VFPPCRPDCHSLLGYVSAAGSQQFNEFWRHEEGFKSLPPMKAMKPEGREQNNWDCDRPVAEQARQGSAAQDHDRAGEESEENPTSNGSRIRPRRFRESRRARSARPHA